MLLIYCPIPTPRLRYIANELLQRRLGLSFRITDSMEEAERHDGGVINYSAKNLSGAFSIKPYGLLEQVGVAMPRPEVREDSVWQFVFLETAESNLPFDVFSAAFWLLSRYEEYTDNVQRDAHGRYSHRQSIAFENNFLEMPLVDIWAIKLGEVLRTQFPHLPHPPNRFAFHSTIDIDFAYRYRGIGLWNQVKKLGGALLTFRFSDAIRQFRYFLGLAKDPYDTYDYIDEVCRNSHIENSYFVLMKTGTQFDKTINPAGKEMKGLVRKLGAKHTVGLHPSYFSASLKTIGKEKELLEKHLGKPVKQSRQHYLKITLPDTYCNLCKKGFTDDFSMGYGTAAGFRASTSFAFHFFDLIRNETTDLLIHPVTLMDTTLRFAMGHSHAEAISKAAELMEQVKEVSGTFRLIWHNSNLGDEDGWAGWRMVFEKIHTLASAKQ